MEWIQNQRTVKEMEILKEKEPCNLFLIGTEQGHMSMLAAELAAAWLETDVEHLSSNPDFKWLEADAGVIQAEHVAMIQDMSCFIPQGRKSVCIVEHAETMTVPLQNKLLKVLENGADTLAVIFVSEKPLLDTLMSRCISITFRKPSLEEMKASVGKEKIMSTVALLACEGSMERYWHIVNDALYLEFLEGFFKTFCQIKDRGQLKYILRLTHALKEKDSEYLPDKLEDWQMRGFLSLLEQVFWHLLLLEYKMAVPHWLRFGNLPALYKPEEILDVCRKAGNCLENMKKKGRFTKNDFFELLMTMIPLK